jgi:3-hydroxyacyl-[acyl-carrier-protein] dehydratase
LPHRAPFLFLDSVVEFDASAHRLRARRLFRSDEPYFAGHFPPPGEPIVPGVLLVEAFAQLLAYYARVVRPGAVVFLTGIDKARFRGIVRPGDEVDLELEIEGETLGVYRARAQARVAGRRVCDAVVSGTVVEPPGRP